MYKIINSFKNGYIEGVNDSLNDLVNRKVKRFKYINEIVLLSKIYDYAYIKAYNKTIKNNTLKNKKNII